MYASPAKNRRQRRIAARQAQILEAAASVFSRNGYERATIKEIAEAADVSEGTLYNYFDNKIDLFNGVADLFADALVSEIATIEAESLYELMVRLLTERFRSGRERRLLTLFLYEARQHPDAHRPFVGQALQRIIRQIDARLQPYVPSDSAHPVQSGVAARVITAAMLGFAALYEFGIYGADDNSNEPFLPEQWGSDVTRLFLDGLQAFDGDHGEGVVHEP